MFAPIRQYQIINKGRQFRRKPHGLPFCQRVWPIQISKGRVVLTKRADEKARRRLTDWHGISLFESEFRAQWNFESEMHRRNI
jgi:hypothetical protein